MAERGLTEAETAIGTGVARMVVAYYRDAASFGDITIESGSVNGRPGVVNINAETVMEIWKGLCDHLLSGLPAGRSALTDKGEARDG